MAAAGLAGYRHVTATSVRQRPNPAPATNFIENRRTTHGVELTRRRFAYHLQQVALDGQAMRRKANVIFFDNRSASPDPQTSKVWFYDYRTNVHHTLKQKPLTYANLEDFVTCYNPLARHDRKPTWSETAPEGRWRAFDRDELLARDKASLDVFWLRDASMTDLENLPEPDVLAEEIMENLRSALASFENVLEAQ